MCETDENTGIIRDFLNHLEKSHFKDLGRQVMQVVLELEYMFYQSYCQQLWDFSEFINNHPDVHPEDGLRN